MTAHAIYLIGWALLGCMAVLSASIIVFPGASVASPAPRRPSASRLEATAALTGEGR